MMVTFVCECEKKALPKTRRVLDAFANRIGARTWQTVITLEGLDAVKKLLRKTASKNTAVSCHWIRSRSRSELVWIVGNRGKFDTQGFVPVNYTESDDAETEGFAMNTQVIALLASLAGLFHDVGKATTSFQNKLNGLGKKGYEPYRHEWVSLRIFQAFVNGEDDQSWLTRLVNIDNQAEPDMLKNLEVLKDGIAECPANPFNALPPTAKLIAWLIVSHHKLPQYPKGEVNEPNLANVSGWLESLFEPCWNTPQCLSGDWETEDILKNWSFPYHTPLKSAIWQTQASELAKKVLKHERVFSQDWLHQRFTAHLSRLSLMLADHYYSSGHKIRSKWQDRNYNAYANTYKNDKGKKELKQKLDEHNVVVGETAYNMARQLPTLRSSLPSLKPNKKLVSQTIKQFRDEFGWQDTAFAHALSIKEDAKKYGFFGVCQASTGKGKTIGNIRIMYALSEERNCRLSIALGLRTLTLQTGTALEKALSLKEDLAILIGSQAVKDLHAQTIKPEISEKEISGSESAESLLKDQIDLIENLPDLEGDFAKWFEHDPKITKLIQAPVLVSTIDYLMPANEGIRGGRQIAPMLRLLTSDLVLDEPDDFGLADLPALCRLVNWAGMLGSRVLLSTATISPSLASTLFEAYQEGRKHFTEVNGEFGVTNKVCCAWFDEFKKPQSALIDNTLAYQQEHGLFVDKRIKKLEKNAALLRLPKYIPLAKQHDEQPINTFASVVKKSIHELHDLHAIPVVDKQLSIGLVRMANINTLVHVAKALFGLTAPKDTKIHYCIYHSQFILLQRSSIEAQLDKALSRTDESTWLNESGLPELIKEHEEKQHIFVVLATPVAEVGRDHDYDWAIVEPSSNRSIIQLAGRVQRHRKAAPASENIHILSKNINGLLGKSPSFTRPGFESSKVRYSSNDLFDLIDTENAKEINATPRIKDPQKYALTESSPPRVTSFTHLEHITQKLRLIGSQRENDYAAQWWQNDVSWCGELQRIQPFRASQPSDDFRLKKAYTDKLIWEKKLPRTSPAEYQNTDDIERLPEDTPLAKGNVIWSMFDFDKEVELLSEKLKKPENYVINKFTHLSLRILNEGSVWQHHPVLGVYEKLSNVVINND